MKKSGCNKIKKTGELIKKASRKKKERKNRSKKNK